MKKFLVLIFFVFLTAHGFCQMKIGVLKGMTAIPFAAMLDLEDYEFCFYDSPVDLAKELLAGNITATCLGSVSAEKLVEKSQGFLCATVVTSTADFKLVGRRTNTSFSTLPGKKIGIGGRGVAERMFRILLKINGIPLEKGEAGVELVYYSSEVEAINRYINNDLDYVVTSEPATTYLLRRGKFNNMAMDLGKEYKNSTGNGSIPLSVIVIRSDFIEENPEQLKKFYADLENSIVEAKIHPGKVSRISTAKNLGISGNTCYSAIRHSDFCYEPITGSFHLIVNP